MSNPWFRLYSEFATDPKMQMMSEAYQRRYIMLLCLRCSNGDVTLQDDEVAFQLRISNDEWVATKQVFIEKKLLGKDGRITAWDKRQYVSDSSRERVAKFREKQKQACNVTVTPPESDTDTDISTTNVVDRAPKRATQLPDDFYPNATGVSYAEAKKINLAVELESFSNWHKAKGTTMKDWQAAWRTWCDKAVGFGRASTKLAIKPMTAADRYVAQDLAIKEARRAKELAIEGEVIHAS